MRITTVMGTRPELIRLSRIIPLLDELCDHDLVWTGQNFDPRLSDLFFEELGVRSFDAYLEVQARSFGAQVGQILERCETRFREKRPDRVLILGDTNSAMSAWVAKRMGIPVYHMEAGNRCHDDRVPEEVNRRAIDACSDVLLPYTNRSRDNLLEEGYPPRRIHVPGNPIWEVLEHYKGSRSDDVLGEYDVEEKQFFLVTAHRAENVDVPERLHKILSSLSMVHGEFGLPVLVSTHPRTRHKITEEFDLDPVTEGAGVTGGDVRWLEPLGFHDFVSLEERAFCVLSDSGTVQEECCLLRTPTVTLRDTTERPETVDCGSNLVCGVDPLRVLAAVRAVVRGEPEWQVPEGYAEPNCSRNVARILLSEVAWS